jgi:hypothetical protein
MTPEKRMLLIKFTDEVEKIHNSLNLSQMDLLDHLCASVASYVFQVPKDKREEFLMEFKAITLGLVDDLDQTYKDK